MEGLKTYCAKVTAKDTFVDEQPIIRINRALVHKSTKLVRLASNHIASLLYLKREFNLQPSMSTKLLNLDELASNHTPSLLLSGERVQFAAVDVHKFVGFGLKSTKFLFN